MGMTAAELSERMDGAEFDEHMADYVLSPWGDTRDDVRTAAIMEVVANSAGGKLTRQKAFQSINLDGKREPEAMSEEQMMAALRMLK